MNNKRGLLRLKVSDFLEIRSLNEVAKIYRAKAQDVTPMGICFSSELEWKRGQVLLIDYFIPDEFDSVKLKVAVVWSEFISTEQGYFCGGEIVEIEKEKQEKFHSYYSQRLGGSL
ncbi:MAG: hypothetical protein Q8O30_02385 [Candidatus Omnitrophota bacterium]|nr:hypothetical protein [Candidatus Omnitrophota bacterium]